MWSPRLVAISLLMASCSGAPRAVCDADVAAPVRPVEPSPHTEREVLIGGTFAYICVRSGHGRMWGTYELAAGVKTEVAAAAARRHLEELRAAPAVEERDPDEPLLRERDTWALAWSALIGSPLVFAFDEPAEARDARIAEALSRSP